MKKSDLIFARKEFLNLPGQESIASIVTHIKSDCWRDSNNDYRRTDVELIISDCSDQATLVFDYESDYDRLNGLHKVDTLISVLTDFRKAMVIEYEIQAEFEAKRELKKKEEAAKKKAEETSKLLTETKEV